MTDQELIALLKTEKRHKAFVKLYRYYRQVEKHIRSNNGSKDEAADIFQEALIILYKKANEEKFTLTSSLDTYLYSVCSNMWADELKKRSRKTSPLFTSADNSDNPLDESIAGDEKYTLAETALAQVTEACRQLLSLFYVGKLSMQEIAAKMEFSSEKSAKTQKYKCLERAREIYIQLSSQTSIPA